MNRFGIIHLPLPSTDLAVELGVAAGSYSSKIVEASRFKLVIGVDSYEYSHHNVDEYKSAILKTGGILSPNYKLLRMRFSEALDLFPDNSIDFLYIDGFAHLGENGGQTLHDWAPKVKINGIIAGDDYHNKWPLVVQAVDNFIMTSNYELNLTTDPVKDSPVYSQYPSWYAYKSFEYNGKLCQKILESSRFSEKIYTAKQRLKKILKIFK